MCVVYFDQRLGAALPLNAGQNSHFQHKMLKNAKKRNKFATKFRKIFFFKLAPKRWSTFFVNKTLDQRFGGNLKKNIFCKILRNFFCFFEFFQLFCKKTLKMYISTSVWCVQYPNAGQNIHYLWTTEPPNYHPSFSSLSFYLSDPS